MEFYIWGERTVWRTGGANVYSLIQGRVLTPFTWDAFYTGDDIRIPNYKALLLMGLDDYEKLL